MTTTPLERVSAVATIVAPVLLLASTVAYGTLGEGHGVGGVGGLVQVVAMIAFAVAVVGLARWAEPAAPRAAAALTVLCLAGTAGGVAFGVDGIQAGLFGTPGLDEVDLVGALALRGPGLLFPPSMAALAILLGVTGRASRPVAAAFALAALLFPVGRIFSLLPVAVVTDLLLIATMGVLGLRLLRGAGPRSVPTLRETVTA
ncbi:hypothetical protein [Actinomycetospora straminea]|uniref:Uncharacterized protein n=1 Tax=Actinomycetospora straminea TaxID=663607 RepID=A0ABP9EIH1_9PSEU|nr:hypothetical protein [Actinomycetospora straminea]MDD7933088.1 hypothetical protein [Actinomycetospora straminea]